MKEIFKISALFTLASFIGRWVLSEQSGLSFALSLDFILLGIFTVILAIKDKKHNSLFPRDWKTFKLLLLASSLELVRLSLNKVLLMKGATLTITGQVTNISIVLTLVYLSVHKGGERPGKLGAHSVVVYILASLIALVAFGYTPQPISWLLIAVTSGALVAAKIVVSQVFLDKGDSSPYLGAMAATQFLAGGVIMLFSFKTKQPLPPSEYWLVAPIVLVIVAIGIKRTVVFRAEHKPQMMLYFIASEGFMVLGTQISDLVFVPDKVNLIGVFAALLAGVATLLVSQEKKLFRNN